MFDIVRHIVNQFPFMFSTTVFDIGCGKKPMSKSYVDNSGVFENLYVNNAGKLYLIDINESILDEAFAYITSNKTRKHYLDVIRYALDFENKEAVSNFVDYMTPSKHQICYNNYFGPTVICTEMAEHISEKRALGLVRAIAGLRPTAVIFSAAYPFQGGEGHVNCKLPSYWADLFDRHGFTVLDPRPSCWHVLNTQADVPIWRVQNTLLLVNKLFYSQFKSVFDHMNSKRAFPFNHVVPSLFSSLDVIHPKFIEAGVANGWFNNDSSTVR